MNAFLVFLYITAFVSSVNCFPMVFRASMGIKKAGNNNNHARRKKEQEKKREEEEKMKCQYLSKMFQPVFPKTCSVPPPMLYYDIYTYPEKNRLWNYYHNMCIPREPTIFDAICFWIMILVVLFFFLMYLK
jgi:hypothetical protein